MQFVKQLNNKGGEQVYHSMLHISKRVAITLEKAI